MIPGWRLHHVGWAVADLETAARGFMDLGYALEPSLPDAIDGNFNVRLRFLRPPDGSALIELVEPAGEGSSVSAVLKRSGPGPYHLGYCVDDLETAAADLRRGKFRPATARFRAPALGLREIQFFHRGDVGLIELIQWPATKRPN